MNDVTKNGLLAQLAEYELANEELKNCLGITFSTLINVLAEQKEISYMWILCALANDDDEIMDAKFSDVANWPLGYEENALRLRQLINEHVVSLDLTEVAGVVMNWRSQKDPVH